MRDFRSCSKTEDIKSASQQIALGQGGNGSPTTIQQIEPKECLTNVQHDSASLFENLDCAEAYEHNT